MSYDAECYCATNDGIPCVFCEIETSDRLKMLARNLSAAAMLCAVWRQTFENTAMWIRGEEVLWRPGCGRSVP